jgi:hypothetical protein
MQHRPRSNFNHIKIHGGKVRICLYKFIICLNLQAIIYSLLPLVSLSDDIPRYTLNESIEVHNDILPEYLDMKLKGKEDDKSVLMDREGIDKLPKMKKTQDMQICPSIKFQTNTLSLK